MKKVLLIAVALIATITVNAQAKKQLSFGLVGVTFEIPVASAITVAPTAFTDFNFNYLILGVKGNYYFDDLFGLPSAWDVYGGANVGFGIAMNNENSSDLDLGLQIGGRWFWNETWGLYLELGGGKLGGAGGGIGVTMVM